MTDRDVDLLDSAAHELAQQDVDDRPVAERHERLRQDRRVRREAGALPAGHDHRLHPVQTS
jgi:hypothetical protein